MRVWWPMLFAAISGGVAGIGLTYSDHARYGDSFELYFDDPNAPERVETASGPPRVEVESEYDFGSMEHNTSDEHEFVIMNVGGSPLDIQYHGVSCGKCVQTELGMQTIEPGGSFPLRVGFATRKTGPEFYEYIEVRTNDPDNQIVRMAIRGFISKSLGFSVGESVQLGSISVNEEHVVQFQAFTYLSDRFEVTGHRFLKESTRDYFEVEFTPLDAEEIKTYEPRATAGVNITMRVKPGLRLGPLSETFELTTALDDEEATAELSIQGKVISDISLLGGRNLDRENNLLNLGKIERGKGISQTIRLHVRGPFREDVQFSVGEIDPEGVVTASLGEVTKVGDGGAYLHELTIGVDKDARTMNRLGSKQGQLAKVYINTTHPNAKKLLIYLRFAVE